MGVNERAESAALRFVLPTSAVTIAPLGNGHIHDTYAVATVPAPSSEYVLQRINRHVFPDVAAVMRNLVRIIAHLDRRIVRTGGDPARETLSLIPALEGDFFWVDDAGDAWRMFRRIDAARSPSVAEALGLAREIGAAFGRFVRLLSDCREPVSEVLPGFHDTRNRIRLLQEAFDDHRTGRGQTVRSDADFALQRAERAGRLGELAQGGIIPTRLIHNDTKYDNVLIDEVSRRAVCVIDLDTVMSGIAPLDLGDCARSILVESERGTREPGLSKDGVNAFERLAAGFLAETSGWFTASEVAQIVPATWTVTLECGVRFLTAHLTGDAYFKAKKPEENLSRCRQHFELVRRLETSLPQLEDAVGRAWRVSQHSRGSGTIPLQQDRGEARG